ncbi:hypothetical protein B566_EDAN007050 [Ephemera danica]|nr:hypothetical protein B566_EDAN007050 [Ephemera danica]
MEHLSRILAALCLVASCLATPADIKACSLRGQSMGARTELRPSEDPCLTCVCDAHGSMTCSTSACPALACPPSKRIHETGQCCQRCIHGREFSPFPGQSTALISPPSGICLMGNQVLNKQHDTATAIDTCNRCRCLQLIVIKS